MENIQSRIWTLPNRTGAAAQAVQEAHDWLFEQTLSSRARFSAGFAVEEILSNIIRYAYNDDNEHTIRFRIAIRPEHIELLFEDDGSPFDTTTHVSPPNAADTEAKGLELIRRASSSMTYARQGNINRTTLAIPRYGPGDTQPINIPL